MKHYARPTGPGDTRRLDITAIVTVTDDGGSSGRLRREFDVLPPGDIRNCMVALSEDSALLSRLFQYRFQAGRGLKGHSFGNLFLMALTQILGDFPDAVKASSEVLKIAGRIYPSTAANVALEATLANGAILVGRNPHQPEPASHPVDPPAAGQGPAAARRAHRHRRSRRDHAGPGFAVHQHRPQPAGGRHRRSHPFLARRSSATSSTSCGSPARPIEFRASDHVRAIHRHAGGKFLDYAVVNVRSITRALKNRYARQAALPVENDIEALMKMGSRSWRATSPAIPRRSATIPTPPPPS